MQYLQAKARRSRLKRAWPHCASSSASRTSPRPFAGTVDDIMVRVGDMASPMQPAARVVNLSAVQLEADVPESYLRSVKAEHR
jgi:membrane fusion protein (multidrug efflux system)